MFKRFFTCYDSRVYPSIPEHNRPLFKVEKLLDYFNEQYKIYWETGNMLSIDEMAIRFQGKHKDKLRII